LAERGDQLELTAGVRRESGSYWAEVRELPGCFASGDSLDELLGALEEAVRLYLADESTGPGGAGRRVAGPARGATSRPRLNELRLTIPV